MKLLCTLLLALFPFLHEQRYSVTLHSVEDHKIVVEENGNAFEITLFNLKITKEEGWDTIEKALHNAKRVEIEVDATSKIAEPLPVYLFVDGELLQETLIAKQCAYTMIHNPQYRYEERLLAVEEAQSTMASSMDQKQERKGKSQGWMFLLFLFCSWCFTIIYWWKKLPKSPFTKS